MDQKHKEKIKESLDQVHQWPSVFMFKFIIPSAGNGLEELKSIFMDVAKFDLKKSSNGKYTSVTVREVLNNSEEVFGRYEQASKIEGIISL